MKFKYIGDGDGAPQNTTFFGVAFELGGVSEVTDPLALKKVRGSRLFEEVAPKPSTAIGTDAKAECVSALLAAGVEVNTRWGLKRLQKEVRAIGSH